MRHSALLLTALLLQLSRAPAIRVFSGSALGQLTQLSQNRADDSTITIKRSWSETSTQTGLYKVKLTQKGYIQFVRYMVDVPALQQYTFCLWVNSANLTHNQPLFSYSRDEKESMVKVWLSSSDKTLKISINNKTVLKTPLQIREGRWYHICQSWSGVTGEWHVFVDGALKAHEKFPRHMGVMLPGGGDIAVGQELTDFNKGLDDGIEGEIFGFNMVDEAIDLQELKDLKKSAATLRADVTDPKNPTALPDFKKMPVIRKSYDDIQGFISKLPSDPKAIGSAKSELLRAGELPASSQPRARTGSGRRPSRPPGKKIVVSWEDRRDDFKIEKATGSREGRVLARPAPIKVDPNIIPKQPRAKINQNYDANYNMHAYKEPKLKTRGGGTLSGYSIFERSDDEEAIASRINLGGQSDPKKRKRHNFDVVSAWQVNKEHPFYLPKIFDEKHSKHYHFENSFQPAARRSLIVDSAEEIVKPQKLAPRTRGKLPNSIPVFEVIDEGYRRRRRRDAITARGRSSRQTQGGDFKPLPALPEEFAVLLNPTAQSEPMMERLSAFLGNKTDKSEAVMKGSRLLHKKQPQYFPTADDALLIEHNVFVPEVSQALEHRMSVPSIQVAGGGAGNDLVRRSLQQCTGSRGSPMADHRHVIVSWADTPVRIYGGAAILNAQQVCGHF